MSSEEFTQHISKQFNADLEEVRSHILAMGGMVEKQVVDAVQALVEGDSGLATDDLPTIAVACGLAVVLAWPISCAHTLTEIPGCVTAEPSKTAS